MYIYIYKQYRTFDVSLYVTVLKNSPDFDLKQIHNDSPAFRIWHWSVTVTRVSTLILDPLLGLLEIVGASQPIQYIKRFPCCLRFCSMKTGSSPFMCVHVTSCLVWQACTRTHWPDILFFLEVFRQASEQLLPKNCWMVGASIFSIKKVILEEKTVTSLFSIWCLVFGFKGFDEILRRNGVSGRLLRARSICYARFASWIWELIMSWQSWHESHWSHVDELISACFAGPEIAAVRRSLEAHIGKAGDTIDIAEFLSAWKCAAGARHVLQGVAGAIGIQRPHRTRFQEKLCQT